jgi:hypothetical protein
MTLISRLGTVRAGAAFAQYSCDPRQRPSPPLVRSSTFMVDNAQIDTAERIRD